MISYLSVKLPVMYWSKKCIKVRGEAPVNFDNVKSNSLIEFLFYGLTILHAQILF